MASLEEEAGNLEKIKPQVENALREACRKQLSKSQIKDIEKAIFAKKGLDTVSDGMSQTVQINEASSVRNTQDDIQTKLNSMFTLGKQNKIADSDELSQLRKTYNK